jgi:hypothetical protein
MAIRNARPPKIAKSLLNLWEHRNLFLSWGHNPISSNQSMQQAVLPGAGPMSSLHDDAQSKKFEVRPAGGGSLCTE